MFEINGKYLTQANLYISIQQTAKVGNCSSIPDIATGSRQYLFSKCSFSLRMIGSNNHIIATHQNFDWMCMSVISSQDMQAFVINASTHDVLLHDRSWQQQGSIWVWKKCSTVVFILESMTSVATGFCSGLEYRIWVHPYEKVNSPWWHSSTIKARLHEKSSQLNHFSPCHTVKVRGVFGNVVLSSGSSLQSTALPIVFMVQGCLETPRLIEGGKIAFLWYWAIYSNAFCFLTLSFSVHRDTFLKTLLASFPFFLRDH